MTTLTERLGLDTADWMSHPGRNCAPQFDTPRDIQHHADLWFPSEGGERMAQKLCRGCPVKALCAAWATPQTDLVGVFGGTTTASRARARMAANRQDGAA